MTAPANLWRRAALGPFAAPIRRPFTTGLHMLLALDQEHLRVYLTPAHLERWGVRADLAWRHALENLHPTEGLRQREDGSFVLESPDGLASSRLCLPGWLASFRGQLPGEPLAAVPCGRRLIVGSARLYGEAEAHFRGEGEPISPCLYQAAATTEPPFGAVSLWEGGLQGDNALRWFRQRLYSELQERMEEEGKRLASYRVHRRLRDGRCLSFAALLPGALYPEVDLLMLPGDRPLLWEELPEGSARQVSGGDLPLWEIDATKLPSL